MMNATIAIRNFPKSYIRAVLFHSALLAGLASVSSRADDYTVTSPGGGIAATITLDASGALSYAVKSGGVQVLEKSPLGITTDKGDFTAGMSATRSVQSEINETYTLPVGKRSIYVNHAEELLLKLSKGPVEMDLYFRAYDEGVAICYGLPGAGAISISGEATGFQLPAGDVNYWGLPHPNDWGYESQLGPLTGTAFSTPVMAEAKSVNHFIFLAQAGTYGNYVIGNFLRTGNLLEFKFPLDQKGPVTSTLPWRSTWHVAEFSQGTPARILESVMIENLNPPTDSALVGAAWVKPGRCSWDYLGGDRNKPNAWVDFDQQMGWEYHVMDAGFEGQVGDVKAAATYAAAKGVGLTGWAYSPDIYTQDKADVLLTKYSGYGLKGIKIDFFDHNPFTGASTTLDYEDTQQSIQIRDMLSTLAMQKHMLVEFHGCEIPTGERRRWPHLMTTEGIRGMEHHPPVDHECVIPFVRNLVGPADYTPISNKATGKSVAEQVATAVIFESAMQVYAPSHAALLANPAVDFLKKLPSTWDDIHFVEGYPASYVTLARRKGYDWFIGGITVTARSASIALDFLAPGTAYDIDIYHDGATAADAVHEKRTVHRTDSLKIALRDSGGFVVYLHPPVAPSTLRSPRLLAQAAGSRSLTLQAFGNSLALPREFLSGQNAVEVYDLQGNLLQRFRVQGGSTLPARPGSIVKVQALRSDAPEP